jgi:uncharacterized protein (DUF169 family)
MLRLEEMHEKAIEIEKLLRLRTYPLALKMLAKEEDVPAGAKRPFKDMGNTLALCQSISLARRQGMSIAMLKEDMRCFEPVVGLGIEPPPEYFLAGHNRYPQSAKTLEAGGTWAKGMPRLEAGKYIGVAVSPLANANYMPDIFILYPDGHQLTQILIAANWIDGRDVDSVLSGHAACVYTIAPVLRDQDFKISSPCFGDRRLGMATADEMIFSGPIRMLKDLAEGIKYNYDGAEGLPFPYLMVTNYQLRPSYEKIGKMLGMNV